MSIFFLPDLGEGLPDAEIHQWFVKEGDTVELDQPIVSMETAKAIVDVPSPFKGEIKKLYGVVGDIIKTGSPLVEFILVESDAEVKTELHRSEHDAPVLTPKKDQGTVVGNLESRSDSLVENFVIGGQGEHAHAWMNATFNVRMLAKKLGVDLNTIVPAVTGAIITAEDVRKAAQSNLAEMLEQATGSMQTSSSSSSSLNDLGTSAAQLQEDGALKNAKNTSAQPLRGVRRTMAQMMSVSHQSVVPVSIYDDADISGWGDNVDISVRIIQSLVSAIAAEPKLNSWFDGDKLTLESREEINLGLAVDTVDGLFVPVIHDVASLSVFEIRDAIDRCKLAVKQRAIPPEQLRGATITLSNFGTFAGRYASPIIVPPTVAILAVGAIRDAVMVKNNLPSVGRILPLSLSFDHRALTGGEATRFMGHMIRALQSN